MRAKYLFTPASTAAAVVLLFAGWSTRTSAASWDQANLTDISFPNGFGRMFEREAVAPRITNASFAMVDITWPENDTIQAPVTNQPLDSAAVDVHDVREWFAEIQNASQGFGELQPRRDFPQKEGVRTQARRQRTTRKTTPIFDGPDGNEPMSLDYLVDICRITVTILLLMVHFCAARLERTLFK